MYSDDKNKVLKLTKSMQASWPDNNVRVIFSAFTDYFSDYGAWTFSVPRLSRPTCSPEWIRLQRWWSACPLHHLLIRVLALTAQNWINLCDPCCCFPSRGQPHITALSLRQQHALLNEILFLSLSLPVSLFVFISLWLGVLTRAWSFTVQSYWSSLSLYSEQCLSFV